LFAEAARRRFRAQVTDRFLCMGGECNYLFRVTPVSATQCPHSTRILFTSAAGPAPARNAERGRLDTIRAAAATAAAGSGNTVPRLTCGGGTVHISLKRMAAAAAAAAGQNEYGMVEVDEKLWVTEEMRGWADGPNPPPPPLSLIQDAFVHSAPHPRLCSTPSPRWKLSLVSRLAPPATACPLLVPRSSSLSRPAHLSSPPGARALCVRLRHSRPSSLAPSVNG
jgi:hypothetical protein